MGWPTLKRWLNAEAAPNEQPCSIDVNLLAIKEKPLLVRLVALLRGQRMEFKLGGARFSRLGPSQFRPAPGPDCGFFLRRRPEL